MFLIVECATGLDSHDRQRTSTNRSRSANKSKGAEVGRVFNLLVNAFQGVWEGLNLPVARVM